MIEHVVSLLDGRAVLDAGCGAGHSTIHTPDHELPQVFAEARRVLRPRGHVLVAFQVGDGVREVGQGYRRLGHEVELLRHDRMPDTVAAALDGAGFAPAARLERGAAVTERSGQAVLIARVRA